MDTSSLVQNFINQIWNKKAFEQLDNILHPDYQDHSLPAMLPTNKEGTKKWILNTGLAFEHNTIIEEQVTENDKSIVKIRMDLKHIGSWRDIAPTGISLQTVGYRYFKIMDGKIIEHWALIDGQSIENQIREASHGCKIAE